LEEISKLEQITNGNEFQILKSSDYSIKKENRKGKRQKLENPKKNEKMAQRAGPLVDWVLCPVRSPGSGPHWAENRICRWNVNELEVEDDLIVPSSGPAQFGPFPYFFFAFYFLFYLFNYMRSK
jgi:hypothetical protein